MNVICLEEKAFHTLLSEVRKMLLEQNTSPAEPEWKWVAEEKAKELLNVKSRSMMQELRDNGEVRFSQPRKRIILYDRDSINDYLERHAKETF